MSIIDDAEFRTELEDSMLNQIDKHKEIFYSALKDLYGKPDEEFIDIINKVIIGNSKNVNAQGFCRTFFIAYKEMVEKTGITNLIEQNRDIDIYSSEYDLYVELFYNVYKRTDLSKLKTRLGIFDFNSKEERYQAILLYCDTNNIELNQSI